VQDLLLYSLMGLSQVAVEGRRVGISDSDVNVFTVKAAFFFDQDLGDIGGILRLLDAGQCNDAYSAVQIALALSNAFGVGVNKLPLSMIISWYGKRLFAFYWHCFILALKISA
jgi:hydroxylamine reductase (hybrid-cluster protein)